MNQLLSPEEFAERAAEAMVEPTVSGSLALDRQQFALVIKDGTGRAMQTTYLHRYFQAYKSNPAQLPEILTDIARFAKQQDDFSDFNKVAPQLMPVIRDRAEHFMDWRRAVREYGDSAGSYNAAFWCEHFVIFPVIDTGNRQARIGSQMLDGWSKSFKEVLEKSAENLGDNTPHHNFATTFDTKTGLASCHESIWEDHYDAVRLCYFNWDLPVKGRELYLMVNPSQLLVFGSEDVIGTATALTKLEKMSDTDSTHKLLPPYVLCKGEKGNFEIYTPDIRTEPALHAALTRNQLKYMARAYGAQQEFLKSDADVQQQDLFVSTFVALQAKDGTLRSTCTWTQSVECLLPQTDFVGFSIINEAGTEADFLGETPWDVAIEVLEEQMIKEAHMYPPRYRTVGFPTAMQLKKMGI